MFRHSAFLALAALPTLFAGCGSTAPPVTAATTATAVSGWYSQHADTASLQPCGGQVLAVAGGDELRQRAERFGLQDGDPVYVRVRGALTSDAIRIEGVDQFGSPTPVRDCPMTGTRIQR